MAKTISNGTLVNCTSNLPIEVANGGTATVTLTASDGYMFANAIDVTYNMWSDGWFKTVTFTLSDDKLTQTATLDDIGQNITIDATAVEYAPTKEHKVITTDVSQATVTGTEVFDTGETVQLTLKSNNERYFGSNVPSVTYTDTNGTEQTKQFVLTDNRNGTIEVTDAQSDIVVNAVADTRPNAIYIQFNLLNCTCDLPQFLQYSTTYNVVVTANKGFEFDETTPPYIGWFNSYSEPGNVELTVSADKKTATGTLTTDANTDYNDYTVTIYAQCTQATSYDEIYGSINLYAVTNEQLTEFAQQRYVVSTDETGNTTYNDMGEFVLKLHRVFVPVGDTTDATISCGRYTTSVQAQKPATDVVNVDFGTVLVAPHNNDVTDYNTDVELFLPFFGTITLDTMCVMGKEVAVNYAVNIVTGDTAIIVSVDGVVIRNETCKCVSQLLYRMYNNDTTGTLEVNPMKQQGLTPYIVQRYSNSRQAQPFNSNVRDTIGNFTGYNVFSDITDLNITGMYLDEYNDIINQLKTGVIICE